MNLKPLSFLCFRVSPDLNKIIVFNKGMLKGLKASIPTGGQTNPNSKLGASELLKYAQKNEKKNNTSEAMNKTIPQRIFH
jgi:hypothetical protein